MAAGASDRVPSCEVWNHLQRQSSGRQFELAVGHRYRIVIAIPAATMEESAALGSNFVSFQLSQSHQKAA